MDHTSDDADRSSRATALAAFTLLDRLIEFLEANGALPPGAVAELAQSAAGHLDRDPAPEARDAIRLLETLGSRERLTPW